MTTFHKYQALGNDFILFDNRKEYVPEYQSSENIRKLCHRRFGVGADGVLVFDVIHEHQPVRMVYYNAGGSRAETCFNGLRCIALHAVRTGEVNRGREFVIESDSEAVTTKVETDQDMVHVRLRGADFSPVAIQLARDHEIIDSELDFPFGTITGTALSTGNPHFVSWRDDLNLDGLNREINKLGPDIEHSPHFRKGINFELANMIEADLIQMAVWERGVGRTLACGSGAVATVCAGVKTGRLEQDRSIRVNMAGGILFVTVHGDSDRVTLRGEANYVFSGSIDI